LGILCVISNICGIVDARAGGATLFLVAASCHPSGAQNLEVVSVFFWKKCAPLPWSILLSFI